MIAPIDSDKRDCACKSAMFRSSMLRYRSTYEKRMDPAATGPIGLQHGGPESRHNSDGERR